MRQRLIETIAVLLGIACLYFGVLGLVYQYVHIVGMPMK